MFHIATRLRWAWPAAVALAQVACAQTPVALAPAPAPAVTAAPAAMPANRLPAEVEAALARAQVPLDAVSIVVMDAGSAGKPLLDWRSDVPRNPASVMKLVTSFAALELLGPAYTWETPVFADGAVQGGVLRGNLYLQGVGDPKLVMERLWLLLRQLRARGIDSIAGDIVLDRSAFALPPIDPARFDNEPYRPYNAVPDALLLNYKSLTLTLVPDAAAGVARVLVEPAMAGLQIPATVPLARGKAAAACGDWRAALQADFSDPARLRLAGSYPPACGEKSWSLAPAPAELYAPRLLEGMWRELGGKLGGAVRAGSVPPGLTPLTTITSPSLAEVVRDINKYSNNVMAQQVFLTLGKQRAGVGSFEGGRQAVAEWWSRRVPGAAPPVIDNGAGLSRDARITAGALARMLSAAWNSPVMPELVASMPIVGVDGTLRHSKSAHVGGAHLKTGTLRDATAIAGYVDAANGRRLVVAAIANDERAVAARAAWDALVDWAAAQ
ncbi:D-alanyl-D-alanine carboxypeptidase/D-alanyl-D-alanine-endopeptidase [Comamonas humi]